MSHDNWRTPPELFRVLDDEFGFDVDAAATEENCLVQARPRLISFGEKSYISMEMNALTTPWGDPGAAAWCNPPYTMIGEFVERAYEQSQANKMTCVVLIPTYTDPKYWRNFVCKAHEIRHLAGRLQFLDEDGGKKQSARFPSTVVIFKWIKGQKFGYAPHVWSWDWRAD